MKEKIVKILEKLFAICKTMTATAQHSTAVYIVDGLGDWTADSEIVSLMIVLMNRKYNNDNYV